MKKLNESLYVDRKSKFYGYLYEIENIDEVNTILDNLKKENKKAKHFCYAYVFNNIQKKYEDKEPSGTSGTQILNILLYKGYKKHLIVVVRYFGGILLGSGKLLKAYKETANALFK
jgi:putative IMPACT (imprinted ancient) family translation regulator